MASTGCVIANYFRLLCSFLLLTLLGLSNAPSKKKQNIYFQISASGTLLGNSSKCLELIEKQQHFDMPAKTIICIHTDHDVNLH